MRTKTAKKFIERRKNLDMRNVFNKYRDYLNSIDNNLRESLKKEIALKKQYKDLLECFNVDDNTNNSKEK